MGYRSFRAHSGTAHRGDEDEVSAGPREHPPCLALAGLWTWGGHTQGGASLPLGTRVGPSCLQARKRGEQMHLPRNRSSMRPGREGGEPSATRRFQGGRCRLWTRVTMVGDGGVTRPGTVWLPWVPGEAMARASAGHAWGPATGGRCRVQLGAPRGKRGGSVREDGGGYDVASWRDLTCPDGESSRGLWETSQ